VIDGQRQSVFIRDVQYNLLRRAVDHVDFYAANLNVDTTVSVPVVLTGEAPIVARGEGVVSLVHPTVSVRALPANIPTLFEVDASRIESVDNDVRVGDLTAPAGVTIVDAPDTVIVSVSRTTVDVEVEEAAAAAAAEAAEAATAEAAEGAADETAADENA
jgi:large subunit ribosomal protein L25